MQKVHCSCKNRMDAKKLAYWIQTNEQEQMIVQPCYVQLIYSICFGDICSIPKMIKNPLIWNVGSKAIKAQKIHAPLQSFASCQHLKSGNLREITVHSQPGNSSPSTFSNIWMLSLPFYVMVSLPVELRIWICQRISCEHNANYVYQCFIKHSSLWPDIV